ncbi:excalibur calcium-binding domain-containing protein [Streptomyces subrutilus]|uniref:excalibur calcium-binding domain-containing protein n=1 Tax=Streptomyces subrutilus TaxID=36818 RepID=UPI001FCACE3A|nr:excalibur calcium-binding domain-containing protein [Streptomyces subrutilus]
MARWDKAGRAVTVVLASVWFVVLLAAVSSGPKPVKDDTKPASPPVVTVTVTAPPPPAPSASTPSPSPSAPTSAAVPSPPPSAGAGAAPTPAERPAVRKPPVADDGKAQSPTDVSAGSGSASVSGTSGSSGSGGGGGSVYYRNCTAVRDAGAAPIRRGDAGYGSHLDRDGDGVACE